MLQRLCGEVLDRLTGVEQTRRPSDTSSARVGVLKDLYLREAATLTREEQLGVLRALATSVGVESFVASGKLGAYQGSTRDYAVLARYAAYGTWDPSYQALVIDHLFLDGHGTLIDVGANIGLTSIPVARKRRITCYAFEPEPRSYLYLRQNVLANAVDTLVNCINLAMFSKEAVLQFELADGNMGDNRVQGMALDSDSIMGPEDSDINRHAIEVRASTLDVMFEGKPLESPIILKSDTQGSEVHVLRGGAAFLRRVDYVISEFEPYLLRRIGDSIETYIEAIAAFPYGAIQRNPDDLSNGDRCEPPQLEPIETVIENMRTMSDVTAPTREYANLILSRRASLP